MTAVDGMAAVRQAARSLAWLAGELSITRGAVSQWARVPAERVLDIERLTGVPRHVQRPDIYPVPAGFEASAPEADRMHASGTSVLPDDDAGTATPCHVPSFERAEQDAGR